jgi:hypothetical protein
MRDIIQHLTGHTLISHKQGLLKLDNSLDLHNVTGHWGHCVRIENKAYWLKRKINFIRPLQEKDNMKM